MPKVTKEQLVEIVRMKKPSSLSAISQALGYKGAISGSLGKHIRELVPGIDEVLTANRTAQAEVGGKTDGGVAKKVQAKEPKKVARKSSKFPRHPKNPFREGSSYSTAFDLLASRKSSGIRRDEAVKLLAEATGKDEKHAGYDLSVLCSARESGVGPRHKSCKEGFWIRREADHVTLMVD